MYEDARGMTQDMRIETANWLAATVGHELNNLTTILQGRLQLTRHAAGDAEPLARHVDELERTGRELHACIDRLHVLAHGQSVVPETVDVNEALTAAERDLRRVAGDARVELVPATVPVMVTSSRRAVELAFLHLTENAARAGATGIRLVAALEKSGEVVVEVRDDGPGLPPDVARCLGSGRILPDCCGLGLLLARTVTERSGGRLEAASRDAGALLRLRFRQVGATTRKPATGEPRDRRVSPGK